MWKLRLSGLWNLPQSVAQLGQSCLNGGIVTSVPLFSQPWLYISFSWSLALFSLCWQFAWYCWRRGPSGLTVIEVRLAGGSGFWVSCQNLVIPDTWPAQRCRARVRPARAWGERGGDVYLCQVWDLLRALIVWGLTEDTRRAQGKWISWLLPYNHGSV